MATTETSPITVVKTDVKTFVLSHLIWVVAISVALLMGHAWLGEHDARVRAEADIKASQATVVNLQQQIAANNAQAAKTVQVIVKTVSDVKTPAQAVAAIPTLTDTNLNARVAPDNPSAIEVDAILLIEVLGQCKVDRVNLDACSQNLKAETEIVTQKDAQIAILKRKPKFWSRVSSTLKKVGLGIGIGLVLSHGL